MTFKTIASISTLAAAASLCATFGYCAENESSTGYADGSEKVKEATAIGQPPPADAPYRNPALDVEKRIDDLLPRLTDEEKMQLIHSSSSMTLGHIPRIGLACFRTPDAGGGARAEDRPGITYFPSPIAYAASFDRELSYQVGRAMGEETRGVYPAAEAGPNGTDRKSVV